MYDRTDLLKIVAAACPAPICAEVGVYKGQYARQMLDTLNPAQLVLIDPWGQISDGTYADYPNNDVIEWDRIAARVINGLGARPNVTVMRTLSLLASASFPDAHFDFIYVDANHSYEAVKADLAAWLPKVKPGGFIGGHDIDRREVRRAVMEVIGHLSPKITEKSGLKSYLAVVA
jgi:hypothetical protein